MSVLKFESPQFGADGDAPSAEFGGIPGSGLLRKGRAIARGAVLGLAKEESKHYDKKASEAKSRVNELELKHPQ